MGERGTPEIKVGQLWEGPGWRLRVEGFSNDGWVKVREIGGERRRSSFPSTPFKTGAFRPIEDRP